MKIEEEFKVSTKNPNNNEHLRKGAPFFVSRHVLPISSSGKRLFSKFGPSITVLSKNEKKCNKRYVLECRVAKVLYRLIITDF